MITVAKYYAASLFFMAAAFFYLYTDQTTFYTKVAPYLKDQSVRVDAVMIIIHMWLFYSFIFAIIALVARIIFVGQTSKNPRKDARPTEQPKAPTA